MTDERALLDNSRSGFVHHASTWPAFKDMMPALLEVAAIRFGTGRQDWIGYWDDVWHAHNWNDLSCAWISPRGNLLLIGFGDHDFVCRELFQREEGWVEQKWCKVTRTGVYLGNVSRPTPEQRAKAEQIAEEWERALYD